MASNDNQFQNLRRPRLLTRGEAAAYCSVSVPTFERVCSIAPVALIKGNSRLHRFDIRDIDAWIDSRKDINDNKPTSNSDLIDRLLS